MQNEFKREPRYMVLKIKDALAYLSACQLDRLQEIGEAIAAGRAADGKLPLNAVVVEQDWPEFDPTWAAIELRVLQEKCAHEWVAVVAGDPTWCRRCGASGPCAD